MIGKRLEVEFVLHTHRGRTGMKARQRVGGRYSFPDRSGPQPEDGEVWEVEVTAQNPAGSVYFLRCIRRISTRAERRAAAEARRQRREELRPKVQAWLDNFSRWEVHEHLFKLEGVEMSLRTYRGRHETSAEGLVVTLRPEVEYLGSKTSFNEVKVTFPWEELEVAEIKFDSRRIVTAVVTAINTRHQVVFDDHAGEVEFLGWERDGTALLAQVRASLNGVSNKAAVKVAEFKVKDSGKGELVWLATPGQNTFGGQVDKYLPEVSEEHRAWLEGLMADHEAYGVRMRTMGLLSFSSNTVAQAMREELEKLGSGGLGFSPWGKERYVLNPAWAPFFSDLPVEVKPAEMKEGAPEHAWQAITWFNGEEPPSQEEIEQLATATRTVEAVEPVQEWLAPYGQREEALPAEITCEETENSTDLRGNEGKYVFHAMVAAPVRVKTYRRYTFGAYTHSEEPTLAEQVEERPGAYTFEAIAYGNAHFEGAAELEVYLGGRKNSQWKVRWEAPETRAEEVARKTGAIRELVEAAEEREIVLTGWRYGDTGNPIVFVKWGEELHLREFDRETYQLSRRKGFGSTKGRFRSEGSPGAGQIQRALETYREYGWPVEADEDWQDAAGKPILSIFPAELVAKLRGGA